MAIMTTYRPIDFSKYPVRTCQSLHCCDVCGESITLGQEYRDGGYGRRAHVACVGETGVIDPGCTGLPHLCPKCGESVPPEQVSQVCAACSHSLVYPYSTQTSVDARRAILRAVSLGPTRTHDQNLVALLDQFEAAIRRETHLGMTVPADLGPLHSLSLGPEPTTVSEWIEQCNRTGILEFPLLLSIATELEKRAEKWQGLVQLAERLSLKDSQERDRLRARIVELVERNGELIGKLEDASKTAVQRQCRSVGPGGQWCERPAGHGGQCGSNETGLTTWKDGADRKARPCTHGLLNCQPCAWLNGFSVEELQANYREAETSKRKEP